MASARREPTPGDLTEMTSPQPRLFAPGLLADVLFREGAGEAFREGYVFRPDQVLRNAGGDKSDWGYWSCDVANNDRLAWSDRVYQLFGLPTGTAVDREWAVTRYSMQSRATLQRVRDFALRYAVSFILDAEIQPEGAGRQWIRVLALPESENGRIVRLRGVKRLL
jgi:hypothetical protein